MEYKLGKCYDELTIGEKASFTKTVTDTDVTLFVGITGDTNPVHVNEVYAKTTKFGGRIVHGPLTLSLMASVLGTMLPGLGSVLVSINADFLAPVYLGDTITATAQLVEKIAEKKFVRMALTYTNQEHKVVAAGYCVMRPPRAGQ